MLVVLLAAVAVSTNFAISAAAASEPGHDEAGTGVIGSGSPRANRPPQSDRLRVPLAYSSVGDVKGRLRGGQLARLAFPRATSEKLGVLPLTGRVGGQGAVRPVVKGGPTGSQLASPEPTPWPERFHAVLFQNRTGKLALVDLWYDFPLGLNVNIIRSQLGRTLYDVEWTNGTSFYFDSERDHVDAESGSCIKMHFDVGILPPNWLAGATYKGVKSAGAFDCHVWEKADFITYWESVELAKPVQWTFFTGAMFQVMSFHAGAVLPKDQWQAPPSCFK